METRGTYYDGDSSARREVAVSLTNEGRLRLLGEGVELSFSPGQVGLSPKLGALRRSLYLPGGAKCEIEDGALADALGKRWKKGTFFARLHRWESSLKLALCALAITVGAVWLFFTFGIPALARQAAFAIPPGAETVLGRETLEILDRMVFRPTALDEARRTELLAHFDTMAADLRGEGYRLAFRAGGRLGPNALALPGGVVILTDELIALAERDEELIGVLAHEIGHLQGRHALRQVLQNSATGLIVATITGDIFSASSLAAALPTMLVDAKFSRDMEREADEAAVAYLDRRGLSRSHFAAILGRLQATQDKKTGNEKDDGSVGAFLSTHPATRERIERLEKGE